MAGRSRPRNSLTLSRGVGYGRVNVPTTGGGEVVPVRVPTSAGNRPAPHAATSRPLGPARTPLVLPGSALLALAMSLRARGLRGLDFLRRSVDRAPPTVS
jgi:hypothetical protein